MGMFDTIEYKGREYQTKSLECVLDRYKLDNNILYHEAYDIEDRSDPSLEGLARYAGMLTKINKRWVRTNYTGEVRFYDYEKETNTDIEYSAYFYRGYLKEIHELDDD